MKYVLDKTLLEVVDTLKEDAISLALRCDSEVTEEYLQRIEEVKQAVKKQTPMKVDLRNPIYFYCPNCNHYTIIFNNTNYCKECGQALDFTKPERNK